MNLITIENVRGYVENDKVFLHIEDVARGLGFTENAKSGNKSIRWRNVFKYLGKKVDKDYIPTKEDIAKLIQSTNRVIDKKWYELAGLTVNTVILSKEQETIGFICDCFKFTQLNLQHTIGNYRIDLYMPEYKIAIECDEFDHNDRDNEVERQEFIENELGCKFIRFNPDSPTFKIQDVICSINKHIVFGLQSTQVAKEVLEMR